MRQGFQKLRRAFLRGLLLWAAAGLVPGAARADEIAVRAQVDRTNVTLEDQISLQVIVEGRVRSVEDPERPAMDGFDLYVQGRSQSMQIVNGDVSASTIFSYLLVPKREGKFTVPPFVVRAAGKEFKTEPITISVGGSPTPRGAPGGRNGEPEERADREVFVLSRVDKQNAFVNEQVLYTFYLYRAVDVTNMNYSQPGFQGFWVEKLKDNEKQYYKVLNGRRYIVHEVTTALFPTTSGKLTIEPSSLQLVMLTTPFGFSLFDRGVERVLKTKALEVDVSALPVAAKPAIFEGAVGEGLQLSAKIDRAEVAEGDPVTLTVRVEGSGNVKTFSKPKLPDLPQFKSYDSDSKTDVQALERVAGSRTWEIVLVPKDEGDYQIAPLRLAYFDTNEGRYRTLETKPMHVTVVKGTGAGSVASSASEDQPVQQQDIQILGKDLAHIHTDVAVSDQWTPLYRRGVFAALMPLPLCAALGATLLRRRRHRFATDVALARSTRARKLAVKRLAAARQALGANQGEAFYAEVQRALRQYVGDKLNASAAGMTHGDLEDSLRAAQLPDDLIARLIAMLERCDAARFAPGSMGGERLRETLQEAEAMLVALDSQWGRRSKSAAVAGTGLAGLFGWGLALLLATGAMGFLPHTAQAQNEPSLSTSSASLGQAAPDYAPPEEWLRRGHQAYEAGKFAEAVAAYRQAEHGGVRNGGLYYDLGNAYYKDGDLGQAIAAYRRAEMLTPRDAQLRANLAFVLQRREDKAVQPRTVAVFAWVQSLYRSLSLNEWVATTAALYVLTCLLWIARALLATPARVSRFVFRGVAALFALALVFTAAKARSVRGVERAVIGESRIAVMSGPGGDYTAEFSLHEGAEVRVQSRRTDWAHVYVTDQLHGWVPSRSLIGI